MSSSVTDGGFGNQGKLLLRVAENGHSFQLDCDEATPVEAVMRAVHSSTGISSNEQLLLSLDTKLEPQRQLSAYKLPANDREVFIFNKARLQSNAPPPPLEQIETLEVTDPPPPASLHDHHPLDDASDPALKALPSYERQFRYHFHKGNSIYSLTIAKYEHCERLVREQRVQERAVEVATCNLEQYYKVIYQNYLEFMRRYKQQHRVHYDLLSNFGRDLEKLRSTALHPALQRDTRRFLVDFVKEESLRKSKENCESLHKQFENKIAQFQQMFVEVKQRVEELFAWRANLSVKNLEQTVKEHQRFINEQKSIVQSLRKDVNTVKKLVDDCLSDQPSSSLRPHDAVSALGPMYDGHDKIHLPRMQACDSSISELLEYCRNKKNEMNNFVHHYMQKITYVTYVIKDAKFQFPVFREAMVRQDGLFMDLKVLRGIGPAYRACLAEVVRRKSSMKLYMGMAGQLAERLATARDVEVQRREDFLKVHGPYIPRDVLASMGLYDTPSQCDVNIAPFDHNLLDIDISDVDRYAPEHLTGFPSKLSVSKGSFSMSNDSALSADAEEYAVETLGKDDNEEFLDACELIEIAGTSKMEVENAKLKAELASAIARICSLCPEIEYELLDDSKLDGILKNAAAKTAEALQSKDEYEKHLLSMLKERQMQCESYEKRIQELEQRLSDEYMLGQKLSDSKSIHDLALLAVKGDDCKTEVSEGGENNLFYTSSEHMDEVSSVSNPLDVKLGPSSRQSCKAREGGDENMLDSSVMLNHQLDSSMLEPQRDEIINDKGGKGNAAGQLGMSLSNSSTAESVPEPLNVLPSSVATEPVLDEKATTDAVLELRNTLADKSNELSEIEAKLKDAMEEVAMLRRDLEMSQKLLDESQMNCAHLENCLHEAREEAQTHLCAAERRASEYSALRASAVKMRGLFERLRASVYAPGSVAGFSESLHSLAQSLANSISENEDEGSAEFRRCIRVLADKVGFLSRHREELLQKYPKLEATAEQLKKELDEKKELVKTLYTKHQLEKQANKEKISFGRLEVHERAAFVLNAAGHYEAINRNCSNYFLSSESVALFTDHLPNRPAYIVGQIVHIECQTVKPASSSRSDSSRADQMDHGGPDARSDRLNLNPVAMPMPNPYGLPVGSEYFIVTIAMLPDTAIHSQAAS